MKDYATEELGVTGGEWTLNENACRVVSFDENAERMYKHKTVCGTYAYVPQDARLIAASKDLYNVLRKWEDAAIRDSNFDCWLVTDEMMGEVKALLARLREATK